MSKAYRLKGTPFGVDRDYPREIAAARRELYQSQEARSARQNRQKVQISYPAKLVIDGRLVRDKFPDWHRVLGEDRQKAFDFEKLCEADDRQQAVDHGSRSVKPRAANFYSNDTVVDSDNNHAMGDDSVFIRSTESTNTKDRTAHHSNDNKVSHDRSRDRDPGQHTDREEPLPSRQSTQNHRRSRPVAHRTTNKQNTSISNEQNNTHTKQNIHNTETHEERPCNTQSINSSGINPQVTTNSDKIETRL